MPSLIGVGTHTESPGNVPDPTLLVPTLPTTITPGDRLFVFTSCTSLTASVGASAGWQLVYSVLGAAGRLAGFEREADGSESAPTITWTGVTTGNSGTPSLARTANWGVGFAESAGNVIVDVLGVVADGAASATTMAGGAAITTITELALIFSVGIRRDDDITAIADVGTGLSWTSFNADTTPSGTDMLHAASWGLTDGPGQAIGAHSWAITASQAVISSGVIVALQVAPPNEPDVLKYTRGRR